MEEELTGKEINLPPEIMHEILSRLPVKPLCRFKLVSNAWLSLISNPKFIAKHSKAIENGNDVFFQRRRLVFTDENHRRLYSLDLDQFFNQNHAVLNNRKENEDADGPVAVATELDFVYDQFPKGRAKKEKKLPKIPTWPRPWKPMPGDLYGLGFDYSTNEYKVVNGQFFFGYGVVFNVYTLKTDSWRRGVWRFPYKPISRDGILVNGGVHWLATRVKDESWGTIICFKLAEDKVREIPLPSIVGRTNGPMELGVFRDRLCITLSSKLTDVKTYNEFWVMKEYGVRQYSWTKMRVSIPYHMLSHSGFWRGGYDLMMIDKSMLVMYSFDDGKYWTLSIKDIDKDGRYGSVGIYVESLVSVITQDDAAEDKIHKKKMN